MADVATTVQQFFGTILTNPLYMLLTVGLFALFLLLLIILRIHKIHSEEVFVHQAWGANWKGR